MLAMPSRVFAEIDPMLAGLLADQEAAAAFDELCTLYVAMTRAKKALYLISSFPGKTSTSFTPASLLKLQLAGESNTPEGETVQIGGLSHERCFTKPASERGTGGWKKAPARLKAERFVPWPKDIAKRRPSDGFPRSRPPARPTIEEAPPLFFRRPPAAA